MIKDYDHPVKGWVFTPAEVEYINALLAEKESEINSLRAATLTALSALQMPCDRWNSTQSKIVSGVIAQLSAAVYGEAK